MDSFPDSFKTQILPEDEILSKVDEECRIERARLFELISGEQENHRIKSIATGNLRGTSCHFNINGCPLTQMRISAEIRERFDGGFSYEHSNHQCGDVKEGGSETNGVYTLQI